MIIIIITNFFSELSFYCFGGVHAILSVPRAMYLVFKNFLVDASLFHKLISLILKALFAVERWFRPSGIKLT